MQRAEQRKHRSLLALILALVIPVVLFVPAVPAFSVEPQPTPAPIITPPTPAEPPVLTQAQEDKLEQKCEAKDLEFVDEADACSHGGDPPPPGKNIYVDVKPIVAASPAKESQAAQGSQVTPGASSFVCDGDGVAGFRTQVAYVRAANATDRYNTYKASIQVWAGQADTIYRNSAADTGGTRRIRFVHDASCAPVVLNIVIPNGTDLDFGDTIGAFEALGYDRTDRTYMMFVDANVLCGVGTMMVDDLPGQTNANNIGPNYGRTDAGCWSGDVPAHEHMHSMGGVQDSAPHSSRGSHCTDEYDVMCYSDLPNRPPLTYPCADSARDISRFDCNYDDYFNTNPAPGSYLALNWNAANNRFLVGGGGVKPCADQAFEPNDSAGAARLVTVGGSTSNAFCTAGDSDWAKFDARAGKTYRITVNGLSSGAEPALGVYGNGGKILLRHSDPPGATAPVIDFTVRDSGTYFVRASDNPSGAPAGDRTYNLTVNNWSGSYFVGGWGYNGLGALGISPSVVHYLLSPLLSAPALQSGQLSAGMLHTLALGTDSSVWAFGWNLYGQLGEGSTIDRTSPTRVPGIGDAVSVSAGGLHSLAAKADGTVWAWGFNGYGQLGDGTTQNRSTPGKVAGLTDVVQVAAGTWHSLALKRDGTVWAWGHNPYGALGDGSTADRLTPVKVSIDGAISIGAGGFHSLAAKSDGTVWAWGYNSNGQLGDGSRSTRLSPVKTSLTDAYQAAAGLLHSVALRNDGTVFGWGWNDYGQSGGSGGDRLSPNAVTCSTEAACPRSGSGQLNRAIHVSAGGFHSSALSMEGRAWSWGLNNIGQLGNGGATDSPVAVATVNPMTLSDIAAGFIHTIGG